jgi:hypothetical protein
MPERPAGFRYAFHLPFAPFEDRGFGVQRIGSSMSVEAPPEDLESCASSPVL